MNEIACREPIIREPTHRTETLRHNFGAYNHQRCDGFFFCGTSSSAALMPQSGTGRTTLLLCPHAHAARYVTRSTQQYAILYTPFIFNGLCEIALQHRRRGLLPCASVSILSSSSAGRFGNSRAFRPNPPLDADSSLINSVLAVLGCVVVRDFRQRARCYR